MAHLERDRRVPARAEDVMRVLSLLVTTVAIATLLGTAASGFGAQAAPRTAAAVSTQASAPSTPTTVALLDSLRPVIERAVVAGDWPMLDRAVARLRTASASAAGRNDPWVYYDLAYALHRRASGAIAEKSRDAKPLVEEAIRAAARATILGADEHARALEGALNGQYAAVGGALAPMRFGPRALSLLDQAVAAAPNDARVALLNGITRVNAPRAFGGGPARAEAELRRAIRLYASDRNATPLPTWGRADAHIWLGLALQAQDKKVEARAEFQRALAISPGHRWVTNQLLPALDRAK